VSLSDYVETYYKTYRTLLQDAVTDGKGDFLVDATTREIVVGTWTLRMDETRANL